MNLFSYLPRLGVFQYVRGLLQVTVSLDHPVVCLFLRNRGGLVNGPIYTRSDKDTRMLNKKRRLSCRPVKKNAKTVCEIYNHTLDNSYLRYDKYDK